jgi:uncharacterized membrane protein YoaK (UPF0700 family)
VLSANAGYVDCAGYLALQGLFSTHVTGNFVTLGAALVLGSSGKLAKLLALPVFCIAVALVRIVGFALATRQPVSLMLTFCAELALLLFAAVLAIHLGPFTNGDDGMALLTGMALVSAMGIQNAVQRLHLAHMPPTTIMTGNTTQAVIDVVDVLRGGVDLEKVRGRLKATGTNIAAFAVGCAAAALAYVYLHMWCFALPPVFALLALMLR